jgi:hypothetical protein
MLRDRRLLYSAGYRAALLAAHADLDSLAGRFQRDYTALLQELEELRAEIAELRALVGVRNPHQRLN